MIVNHSLTLFPDRIFTFFTDKYNSVNYKIGELQGQMVDMLAAINSIQEAIEKIKPMDHDFVDTNRNLIDEALTFSLPCRNFEEFQQLNEEITTSETFRKKMVNIFF